MRRTAMRFAWSRLAGGLSLAALLVPACSHRVLDRTPDARVPSTAQAGRPVTASPYGVVSEHARDRPNEDRSRLEAKGTGPTAVAAARPVDKPVLPIAPADAITGPAEPRALVVHEPVAQRVAQPVAIESKPEPPPKPLVRALECFLGDKPEEALKCLSGYDPRDQELLLRLLPIVARVERSTPAAAAVRIEQQTLLEILQAIVADLRLSAPLVMNELVFCKQVYGFGKYEPLGRSQFRPGEVVKVYTELLNLAERRDEELYVTAVGGGLEIRGPDCKVKWTHTFPITLDQSAAPRTDHFLRFTLTVPPTLPPGFYTLRVLVLDQHTQRQAERSIGFRVTSLASPQLK